MLLGYDGLRLVASLAAACYAASARVDRGAPLAECSFHPGVETEMRCAECERPICPEDMVLTPVGYKCPVCARPKRSQYTYVKPKQLAGAIGAGLVAGVGGAFLLGALGFRFILIGIFWGMLVGEAVRRGSGGHRGPVLAVVAGACIVGGSLLAGLGLPTMVLAVVGAVSTLSWTWTR